MITVGTKDLISSKLLLNRRIFFWLLNYLRHLYKISNMFIYPLAVKNCSHINC